jgi:hypothetical protein
VNRAAEATEPGLSEFLLEVERIRASGALGRSVQLARLFDFLVGCHVSGRVPKEVEVAIDCFDRSPDADAAQDATVRVTAHKLRKRLEEFYREAGEPPRLVIPRGEYRLMLHPAPGEEGAAPAAPTGTTHNAFTLREKVAAGVALVAVLVAIIAVALGGRPRAEQRPLVALRASPLWASVLEDGLPLQLVLGDYYIFGERDANGGIRRLVREFDINSRRDLQQRIAADPQQAGRYLDMNLGYLPTSSAQALREVLPVVMASGKPVILTLASELDPATLKGTHVIYLGYLSGLGMLEDMVLSASRYSLGGSYDELIDSVTGEARISEAGVPPLPGVRYRDYAYVAALKGPAGHTHVVIAGMRDVGLMHAAEAAVDPAHLTELARRLGGEGPFEALYEVQGLNGINVQGRLLEASRIHPAPAG